MKKLLPVLLSLLLVFNLTSQALAVNADDYWFQDSGGTWIYDEVGFELASAIEKVTAAGLSLDPHIYVYNDEMVTSALIRPLFRPPMMRLWQLPNQNPNLSRNRNLNLNPMYLRR